MIVRRRSREFWKRLVAEVDRGETLARTADRHGVRLKTLSWWRWTLRREKALAPSTKLLPVVFAADPTSASAPIEVEIRDDVAVRIPVGYALHEPRPSADNDDGTCSRA